MNTAVLKKLQAFARSYGIHDDDILNVVLVASYFADGLPIQKEVFAYLFNKHVELQKCFQFLQKESLIQYSDKCFFLNENVRNFAKVYVALFGKEENILRLTVLLLKTSVSTEYLHFQTVYESAKSYSSLFNEIVDFPVKILSGMLVDKKYQEAYSFGTDSVRFLTRKIGDGARVVLELKSFFARALLVRIQKREEAIAMLTDVYKNPCHVLLDEDDDDEEEDNTVLVLLARIVLESNTVNSEERLRRIVFGEKTVSDTWDSSDLAKWVKYSEILQRSGWIYEATSILDEVVERGRDILEQDDECVLKAMHVKALALMEEFKLKKAMNLLKSISSGKKADLEIYFFVQIDMGRVLMLMKRYKKSIEVFEKVKKDVRKVFGVYHELHFTARSNIIEAYRLQRDWKKALKFASDLTETFEEFYGIYHRRTLESKNAMGDALLELGKLQEARKIFEELLKIAEKELFSPEEEIGLLRMRIFLTENINLMNAQTSLHLSAKDGNLENVLSLINRGEDIEARDGTGMTPLHYASTFGRVQVAKVLIEKGARFNSQAHNASTPLQVAKGGLMKMFLRSVHFFFEGAKGNNVDRVKAIASRDLGVLKARDVTGCTPMHWAALRGHTDVLKALLEFGCDPAAVSDKGNSPLHIAASKGHDAIAEALLAPLGWVEAPVLLEGKTLSGGNTPLHVAAERGCLGVVRILLSHGAVCNAENAARKTPRLLSRDEGCERLLSLVEGLFLDTKSGDDESGVAKLRGMGDEDASAVMKARNEKNRTLLEEAVERKRDFLAREMVSHMISLM